jgi:selenide,water dikinase
LPAEVNPDLLIGFEKVDDAGVYRINEHQALVQTVDFFPPIVDDPYHFGQIAAANALSDIYAMGAKPLTALNIVAFPPRMAPQILSRILLGGADKIHEAGASIVGGHSIKDTEIKYGLACTGIINIDKIISNAGARPGDLLFLTKPLGTGIIATAVKKDIASSEDTSRLVTLMAALNKTASELMVRHGAHAATDVTGFGILGHAYEMADASGVTIEIVFERLPIIPGALHYAQAGALTGGAQANRDYLADKAKIRDGLTAPEMDILYDAQTSGGLLIALAPESVPAFIDDSIRNSLTAVEIGRVTPKGGPAIVVV